MRIRKFSLDTENFLDNTIIGLSSPLKDYRISHYLNKLMGIELERLEDVAIFNSKEKKEIAYPFFFYNEPDYNLSYYLFANKNKKDVVFSNYKQLDYFLLISTSISNEESGRLIKDIRSLTDVNLASTIALNTIKDVEFILADVEMHMMNLTEQDNPVRGKGLKGAVVGKKMLQLYS